MNYVAISDGHLYSATVADFSRSDPLIFREPLRTEKSDMTQLNGKQRNRMMKERIWRDMICLFCL